MSPVRCPPVEFQTLVCGPGDEPLLEEVGCWLRESSCITKACCSPMPTSWMLAVAADG